ncbi:MAG TPA: N-acetylmuramoyl-L-alanine amidase [Blastocatellia bacterium]|nr:N-acetylmuramoyl-L-alanine amidase [Blastocatellia bacterium]
MQDFTPQNERYTKLVDRYSRFIESPVLRLKFLNSALKSDLPRSRWMKLVPFASELPERAMIIAELSKVLPLDRPAPLAIRFTALLYRIRVVVYAVCLGTTLLVGATLVYGAAKIVNTLSVSTEARDIAVPNQSTGSSAGSAVAVIGSEAGLSLDKVWLAEQGAGFEFYSNGARVLTEFETAGPNRSFYRFDLEALEAGDEAAERLARPVGIVYHVSESDLLPFAGGYNKSLQNHSRALLDYARTHRLYNYVIDRFGRIYRIVRDESAASHAGNSLWSDGRSVYVNLSASFIGVCFEGKSGDSSAVGGDGINEAQIYAARVLTAVLRSKYGIDDANCVTHGLVSVNPSNRLMGYHTDWVSAFPFAALGLSNKYETELSAVSRLGFGYDSAYVAAAGGAKWPGLERADAELHEAAARHGVTVEVERRERSRIFQRAFNKQRELERKSMRTED